MLIRSHWLLVQLLCEIQSLIHVLFHMEFMERTSCLSMSVSALLISLTCLFTHSFIRLLPSGLAPPSLSSDDDSVTGKLACVLSNILRSSLGVQRSVLSYTPCTRPYPLPLSYSQRTTNQCQVMRLTRLLMEFRQKFCFSCY